MAGKTGDARSVELLSPAGDFETAIAAFEAGADAVYCGLADFSARAFARNLSQEELGSLVAYSRAHGRKVYVAFNTIVDEDDVPRAAEILSRIDDIGPDAVIVQDLGVARLCRRHFPSLAMHASTQLVAHNLEGVLALGELGFSRVVLARELSLGEISSISRRCGSIELECFIHGALCYSLSGLCLFSAMEKGRSGNRGRCAYCCRLPYEDAAGGRTLAFSMKDLCLGEDARRLADAGVASLKIEGRMKSPLYVASATARYRAILDGRTDEAPSESDLATVFSRRTTKLYIDGPNEDVIDSVSLGHLGAAAGTVKRIAKDRDGRSWLRFHTTRALERHDGLQFEAPDGGKPPGFGISGMRLAISRRNVFTVAAGEDVEVQLPDDPQLMAAISPGAAVYCSMSNAVKRRFPAPCFRGSDFPGGIAADVAVSLAPDGISATAKFAGMEASCGAKGAFPAAKNPGKTADAVRKAFSRLGGTGYSSGDILVSDPEGVFVPMGALNDLRRQLVERMDAVREAARNRRVGDALSEAGPVAAQPGRARMKVLKIRAGQKLPDGCWDEIVVEISAPGDAAALEPGKVRLALPVYTPDPGFDRLRVTVKRLVHAGFAKWEAGDLATLRMLRAAGVTDITADWTLYAFNTPALAELSGLGVTRFVASPENGVGNLQRLAESGRDVEFLVQQSTPLFISLTKPAADNLKGLSVFKRGRLWVTVRPVPRTFTAPAGASVRIDLSWGAPS